MSDLKDDLLSGASAIADYLNQDERKTYYQLERGYIPGFKVGSIWHMRKSTHIAKIEELEAAAR